MRRSLIIICCFLLLYLLSPGAAVEKTEAVGAGGDVREALSEGVGKPNNLNASRGIMQFRTGGHFVGF